VAISINEGCIEAEAEFFADMLKESRVMNMDTALRLHKKDLLERNKCINKTKHVNSSLLTLNFNIVH